VAGNDPAVMNLTKAAPDCTERLMQWFLAEHRDAGIAACMSTDYRRVPSLMASGVDMAASSHPCYFPIPFCHLCQLTTQLLPQVCCHQRIQRQHDGNYRTNV
jgi:hypothetical protein